jgi:hypothetical protein
MSVNKRLEQAYGFGQGIYSLSPKPIVAKRAPTTSDMALLGTIWLDEVGNGAYILLSVVANSATWIFVGAVTQTATAASPAATVTINSRSGQATFTGFTTASGATQAFVIDDTYVTAASNITATIQNGGTNTEAIMVISSIVPAAGSFTVNTANGGSEALNGNVVITFQVTN